MVVSKEHAILRIVDIRVYGQRVEVIRKIEGRQGQSQSIFRVDLDVLYDSRIG